jgi:putative oxidoreductase
VFPQLDQFTDAALLVLRIVAALVFAYSGVLDLTDPDARSKSIEMPKPFTIFLGIAEVLGAVGILFGVLTQLAALGLILIMLGAIQKKALVWKTGFWGKGSQGWHYEVMLIAMLLVVACTGGGAYVLL